MVQLVETLLAKQNPQNGIFFDGRVWGRISNPQSSHKVIFGVISSNPLSKSKSFYPNNIKYLF